MRGQVCQLMSRLVNRSCFLLVACMALPAAGENIGVAGLSLPPAFERDETLSVAGQLVWEFITEQGDRDLLAVTPHVRPRSLEILRASGYRSVCKPVGPVREILSHQHQHGITWFVIGERRVAHIVLAHGSRHFDHFRREIGALCHPD